MAALVMGSLELHHVVRGATAGTHGRRPSATQAPRPDVSQGSRPKIDEPTKARKYRRSRTDAAGDPHQQRRRQRPPPGSGATARHRCRPPEGRQLACRTRKPLPSAPVAPPGAHGSYAGDRKKTFLLSNVRRYNEGRGGLFTSGSPTRFVPCRRGSLRTVPVQEGRTKGSTKRMIKSPYGGTMGAASTAEGRTNPQGKRAGVQAHLGFPRGRAQRRQDGPVRQTPAEERGRSSKPPRAVLATRFAWLVTVHYRTKDASCKRHRAQRSGLGGPGIPRRGRFSPARCGCSRHSLDILRRPDTGAAGPTFLRGRQRRGDPYHRDQHAKLPDGPVRTSPVQGFDGTKRHNY